jgi:cytochrome c-type biogenesis protein CcmE
MKPAYIIAAFILVASMAVTLYTFTGSIATHVTIPQAVAMPGQNVQIPGRIVKGSDNFNPIKKELRFDVTSMDGKNRITIVYKQPKPENFDSATSVEAAGQCRDGVFYATNLLVKCPSKYNDEKKPDEKKKTAQNGSWWVAAPIAVGVVAWAPLFVRKRVA